MKKEAKKKKSGLVGMNLRSDPRLWLGGREKWEGLGGGRRVPLKSEDLDQDVNPELFFSKGLFGAKVRIKTAFKESFGLRGKEFNSVASEIKKGTREGFRSLELRVSYLLWRVGFLASEEMGDWAVRLGYVWVRKKGKNKSFCKRGSMVRSPGDEFGLSKEGRRQIWERACWHWSGVRWKERESEAFDFSLSSDRNSLKEEWERRGSSVGFEGVEESSERGAEANRMREEVGVKNWREGDERERGKKGKRMEANWREGGGEGSLSNKNFRGREEGGRNNGSNKEREEGSRNDGSIRERGEGSRNDGVKRKGEEGRREEEKKKEIEYPGLPSFVEVDYERMMGIVRWNPQDGESLISEDLSVDRSIFQ